MKNKIFLLILIFFSTNNFFSQGQNKIKINEKYLPQIQNLNFRDAIFKQFSLSVKENDKKSANKEKIFTEFFIYIPQKNENLLTVSAALNIPYDTIASLNGLANVDENIFQKKLIIPTAKGLFISKKNKNLTEIMIFEENKNTLETENYLCYTLDDRELFFLPGKRFSPSSRFFFLNSGIKMPLEKIKITSNFGLRKNPFSNELKKHNGLDLECSEGSKVFACKAGTVDFVKFNDEIFGNYLVLKHNNNILSVYAHLSNIFVKKDEKVYSGQNIALSGSSGKVTGPHLHFEIKENGKAIDPATVLK